MSKRVAYLLGGAGLAVALAVVAGVAMQQRSAGSEGFVAPRVSREYLDKLAKLPDWNGSYEMTGGSLTHRLLFDVDNLYYPADPGGVSMGPMAGAHNTAIPLKPEYAKLYSEVLRKQREGFNSDTVGNCKRPHGMPRQMGGSPQAPTILLTPDYVQMSWSWLGAMRRIYTDGREHPKDFVHNWMGHSIGHWEGDTLVVDTVGMRASEYDQSGAPHSDQVHLKERIRLIDKDTLENQMTIEDPVMLTGPWKVVRRYKKVNNPKLDLIIGYCEPTEDHLDFVNGYQQTVLPSELEKRQKQPQAKDGGQKDADQ